MFADARASFQLESFMMGPLQVPKLSASNFKPQTKTWFV